MPKPKCPAWVHNAVFYEIYPQSFYDTNADGIGDIPGIIARLDYVKSLGVDAVWLNPVYVSPMRDAGYDVADYYRVDPRYGSNADMKRLFREAHRRDLRVIIDFVPGHTSVDHPWFKASSSRAANPFTNWYVWTNSTWDFGGERWAGKMVHGYCERDGNYMTNFFFSQPALNFGFARPDQPWQLPVDHPDVLRLRGEVHAILRHWLDMGVDGFRVDMAGSLIRNDPGGKEMIRFWREIREMIDRDYPETFLVSEWSSPAAALRGGFHADFLHWFKQYNTLFRNEGWKSSDPTGNHSFFHKDGKGDITAFLDVYLPLLERTRRHGYISIPLGNHDLPRINMGRSARDLEIITAFILTIPGVPFLYYGDEIGMRQLEGDHLPTKEGCYPPRNGARTPMQWTNGRNAGFSTAPAGKLYLPVDRAKNAPSVAAQEKSPRSLLNRTRALIALRRSEPALAAHADFVPLYAKKRACPLVYLRKNGRRRVIVALNPGAEPCRARVRLPRPATAFERLAGNGAELQGGGSGLTVVMGGRSYGVWAVR